jgi:hypothetical protein
VHPTAAIAPPSQASDVFGLTNCTFPKSAEQREQKNTFSEKCL